MTSTFGVRDIFVEANGLRHHLIARGSPGTPIVVMLHNLVGQARMFDAPATALADSQHVYALDFRGRGESAWSPPDDYNQATYAADLEAVRDALGLQRFALIGTAMGGGVAMAYAAAHPERVSALVINDIGPDLDSAGVSRISTRTESTPTAFPDLKAVVVSSTGGCNSVLEFSGWGHEAEGLTGAGVQFQGDAVQVLLAVR